MFKELDIVELTHDIKERKLKEGESGTIVLVYKHGKAYEVEFVAQNGKTKALLTLMPNDIRVLTSNKMFSIGRLEEKVELFGTKVTTTLSEEKLNERSSEYEIESSFETDRNSSVSYKYSNP